MVAGRRKPPEHVGAPHHPIPSRSDDGQKPGGVSPRNTSAHPVTQPRRSATEWADGQRRVATVDRSRAALAPGMRHPRNAASPECGIPGMRHPRNAASPERGIPAMRRPRNAASPQCGVAHHPTPPRADASARLHDRGLECAGEEMSRAGVGLGLLSRGRKRLLNRRRAGEKANVRGHNTFVSVEVRPVRPRKSVRHAKTPPSGRMAGSCVAPVA